MLVCTKTGGKDLGNIGIGYGGKAPVYTTCSSNAPLGSHIAQGIDKCKYPFLVVHENFFIITGLNTTKGHCNPVCKTCCKYC